jgi:hypothetical protein
MLCPNLEPGWDFEPLHKTCPRCGCDLSKEFVAPEHDEGGANDVEHDADELRVTRMTSHDADGVHSGLQRVVRPLSEPNPKDAEGNKRGWHNGESLEEPGTSKDENKDSHDHEDLVPVVKRNLGKRIIHWLFRGIWQRHNVQLEGRGNRWRSRLLERPSQALVRLFCYERFEFRCFYEFADQILYGRQVSLCGLFTSSIRNEATVKFIMF